jgi:hypothetical protein
MIVLFIISDLTISNQQENEFEIKINKRERPKVGATLRNVLENAFCTVQLPFDQRQMSKEKTAEYSQKSPKG